MGGLGEGDAQARPGAQDGGSGASELVEAVAPFTLRVYDLRLRGFYNLRLGQDSGFIDGQASYRLRDGDPPNEFHADLTLGYRPRPNVLLMVQSLNTISDGAGRGIFDEYRYLNLQLSGVVDVAPAVALQAGLLGTIAGENALRERGFFGGVWISF